MPNEIVYDNTTQAVAGTDSSPSNVNNAGAGFSFNSDATKAGTLADVKVDLQDTTPADGGSVSVGLYSSASGSPGSLVANLGTILDSKLTTSPALVDVPVTSVVNLAANTQYYIETNATPGSGVSYAYDADASGTGVTGQSYEDSGAPASTASGAYIAQVTETVVCYVSGTLIRTARGDVAVEHLVVGDRASTASGGDRPIRWLGRRTIECASHPRPSDVWPVRILAGAFGDALPERDLFLSPGHPVLVGGGDDRRGGVLVPVMCLINGTSVARVPVDTVTYWHVELDEHDVLLAEGLPAESFLDFGNRPWFAANEQHSAADHALHDPDFIPAGLDARCRPVAFEGAVVEAERRRLGLVFATELASHCDWSSSRDASVESHWG